ncbi:hypothetical protein D0861_04237 [Hortaea werneckii]|uniref:Xylanolytic transcriptional activator regulatory domain-containing protein n=1 Tax=Hortaea werneckii TaxID=91943 RepID=A0A3M7FMB4_HORWE|nr:hypothetical protein D0861_04237 [Hortaea werneckii]
MNSRAKSRSGTSEPSSSGLISPPSSSGAQPQNLFTHTSSVPKTYGPGAERMDVFSTAVNSTEGSVQPSTSYDSPETSMSFREGNVGFLGPTSYSAVFTENLDSLRGLEHEEIDDQLPAPVSQSNINQGAEVLVLLKDMQIYKRFSQRFFEICDGILVAEPAYRIWVDDLWAEFGAVLATGRMEELRGLSELVWRNTRCPPKAHGNMSAREWAKSATGRSLRWEVIGIILSLTGLTAANLSDWDSIFHEIGDHYVDRATFSERMRKVSELCLCFCYESEVLNDLYIIFSYQDVILTECIKAGRLLFLIARNLVLDSDNIIGDAHYAAWQRTGEMLDAVIAMGLHQGNNVNAETPFWLAQLRKKIFVSAYGRDKVSATFLGRPPRLSYRYCKMEEPLDVPDELLFAEGLEPAALLARVDKNGWNTDQKLTRTTSQRVWFQHCRIREDILEIALGSDDGDIESRAAQIRLRLRNLHDSYPAFMKVSPEEFLEKHGVQTGSGYGFGRSDKCAYQMNAVYVLFLHTGIAQTEFLMHRALLNRKMGDYRELILIARRILKLVLLAHARRDCFRDLQGDLMYLLALHGMPTAGVLAIELLKQEQLRQYTPDILPRSETIQDLSVFISALSSVGPGEGNYRVCKQGHRALKRILDQILSPHPPALAANEQQPAFDDMNLYFPTGNDADFLQWLENVDWDKGLFNLEPNLGEPT